MKVHTDVQRWRDFWRERNPGCTGFVPTMGGLHAGHRSLVERSTRDNPVTIVSLFVNPTQFDRAADLASYPSDPAGDLAALEDWGVDHVLMPDREAIYPDGYRYRVTEDRQSLRLEGAHRPGHFDGVLTVVLRLLNLVRPRRAYFGEKDWQQLSLVRGMVQAFFLETEIVACPIVRDEDGLACSSRNVRLDEPQRRLAPTLYRSLVESPDAASAARRLERAGFEVDYVEDHGSRRLAAARLGQVRLIDNVPLDIGSPEDGRHAS